MKKTILLIPMAGIGKRFLDEGWDIPKQLIQVGNKTMIEWSMSCIDHTNVTKIFIVRRNQVDNYSIDIFLKSKFGNDSIIIISETETEGTVSSCLLAKEYIDNDSPLAITTLDVFFTPNFNPYDIDTNVDGTILVFNSDNPAYSYSVLDSDGFITETAEKVVLSNNASVGLYCFSKGSTFIKYAEQMITQNIRTRNEFYVCPLYNLLIQDGLKINTSPVTSMHLMGTPDELNNFLINSLPILTKK
jgi:choline kinase